MYRERDMLICYVLYKERERDVNMYTCICVYVRICIYAGCPSPCRRRRPAPAAPSVPCVALLV